MKIYDYPSDPAEDRIQGIIGRGMDAGAADY